MVSDETGSFFAARFFLCLLNPADAASKRREPRDGVQRPIISQQICVCVRPTGRHHRDGGGSAG